MKLQLKISVIVFIVSICIFLTVVSAQTLMESGYLRQKDGTPLNRTLSIKYRIYSAVSLGTLMWESSVLSVLCTDGLYSVQLGTDENPIDSTVFRSTTQNYFLEQQIEGEILLPRKLIGSVGRAILAERANSVEWSGIINRPEVVTVGSTISRAEIANSADVATIALTANYAIIAEIAATLASTKISQFINDSDYLTSTAPLTKLEVGGTVSASALVVNGSMASALTTKSGSATLTLTDSVILVDSTASPITITLPLATHCRGRMYNIKKIDSTANKVTIAVSGADTIDSEAQHILFSQYQYSVLVSDGVTGWSVAGGN